MPRTSNLEIIDLIEASNQELSAMIGDPNSPLCVTLTELVNRACERYADTETTVEVMNCQYDPNTHSIALIEAKVRGHKINGGYVLLPDSKKLGVRLQVGALRFAYMPISPIMLLKAVKRSNLVASYDMLRRLITTLDNSL